MKSRLVFLIAGLITASVPAYAENLCQSFQGEYLCQNGEVDAISGLYGALMLKQMVVKNDLKVSAPSIEAVNSNLNRLDLIVGTLTLRTTIINGEIHGRIGKLIIEESALKSIINAYTTDILLKKSETGSMLVKSPDKKINVKLTDGSYVDGDINFLQGRGTVCIDGTSIITGEVINGEISRSSC